MAHTKAQGSAKNVHDSPGQRLGLKKFGGEKVIAGNIIVRQRGNKYRPGDGVGEGKDRTIFATVDGTVTFTKKAVTNFNGRRYERTFVSVEPVK